MSMLTNGLVVLDLSNIGQSLDLISFSGRFPLSYVVINRRGCPFSPFMGSKVTLCVLCGRLPSFDYDISGIAPCKK